MVHNINKHTLFLFELEIFLTDMDNGSDTTDIKLKPIFLNVIENLSLLDSTFNTEVGMDLTKHIIIPKDGIKESGILFSDEFEMALDIANVEGTGRVPEKLIVTPQTLKAEQQVAV